MSLPTIEVDGLGKRYRMGRMTPRASAARLLGFHAGGRHHWALRNVSFRLQRGDVLGVIGANGAGKSTLLKLMSRITRPTEGRAVIRGRVGSLLEVGTGFHPELTGMENLFINGAILGMTRREMKSRVPDILDFADIGRYIDTPVKRYSSGMYTRLAFAVAAHLDPEVLIVDEVLAVGDAAFRERCFAKMHAAAAAGRTILFVSHGAANVRALCNKALYLKDGEPVALGPVDETLDRYTETSTAEPHGDDAATDVAVPAPAGHPPVRADRLRFRGPDGTPRARFAIGEPWEAEIDVTAVRDVERCIAALGIVSTAGFGVCTIWSDPVRLSPGRHRFRFPVRLPFKSAALQFVVGLKSDEATYHYAERVGRVDIGPDMVAGLPCPPRVTDGSGLMYSDEPGVHAPATATVSPLTVTEAPL